MVRNPGLFSNVDVYHLELAHNVEGGFVKKRRPKTVFLPIFTGGNGGDVNMRFI